MPYEVIPGFTNLETSKNPKHLRIDQLSLSSNMEWTSENEVYVRRGSIIERDNTNWPTSYVIDAITFKKRDDAFYQEIFFIADGTVWYIQSDDVNFETSSATMTQITASDGSSSPALAVNLKVSFDGINNKLIIVDGSSNMFYYDGTGDQLHLIADPTDFEITYTISSSTAAITDTYEDNADTTRQYVVKASITSATELVLRQTAGETRTAASGQLDRVTGSGSATIAFSAVTYSDTYEEVKLYKRRAFVVANEGNVFVSISRNGTNFTGAGSGRLEIDVIEGLRVSNFLPFKRGGIITTEDKLTEKFSLSTLTGYKFFDAAIPGTEVGQFKVERESRIHGFVGRSGQELGSVIIGLTKNGFISYAGEVSAEFGLTSQDTISNPIKNQIKNVNFAAADQIFSTIDIVNQRYICAAPLFTSTQANVLFVYDYAKSQSDGNHRWSIWFMAFNTISSLFNLKNDIFAGDFDGNVYKLTVDDTFTDNTEGYTARIETAAIGGNTSMADKTWSKAFIDFKIPSTEQFITVYGKADGHIISESPTGKSLEKVKLTPRVSNSSVISDFTFVDNITIIGANTLNDLQIRHDRLGGRAQTYQIGVSSSETGVNWGISGLMLELDARDNTRGQ